MPGEKLVPGEKVDDAEFGPAECGEICVSSGCRGGKAAILGRIEIPEMAGCVCTG